MALPGSGQISLSQVNTELAFSSNAPISLNDTALRILFSKTSGSISLNDGWGKTLTCTAYGTFLYYYCSGPDLFDVYADGYCSTYIEARGCDLNACSGYQQC